MKVLVCNPPGIMNWNGGIRQFVKSGSRWSHTIHIGKEPIKPPYMPFPFSLAYLTTLLKRSTRLFSKHDWTVKGVDGCAECLDYGIFSDIVSKFNPDVIVAEIPFMTWNIDYNFFRKLSKFHDCRLIVVGAFADYIHQNVVEFYTINGFVQGEYEEKVLHLLSKQVLAKKSIKTLDFLGYPDRQDFPPENYHDFGLYEPNIQIITSRGCPKICGFCVENHLMCRGWKRRTSKRVVDEMEYCIAKYDARQFYFDDMSFTISKRHVEGICDEIIERGIGVPWTAMADHMVSAETLKTMAAAGCIGIKIGVESASYSVLDNIPKFIDFNRILELRALCEELGIKLHGTFMLGCFGETKETMQQTLDLALECEFDSVQFAVATPYPGVPFYTQVQEFLNTFDPLNYDGTINCVIDYPDLLGKEILEFKEKACKEWRKRTMRRKIRYGLTHPLYALKKARSIVPALKGAFKF